MSAAEVDDDAVSTRATIAGIYRDGIDLSNAIEIEAAQAYVRLKGTETAARRVASETYRGGRAVSWDEMMQDVRLDWLVGNLLARGTTNFLVGKPNAGKTFAYVSMMLAMVCGLDFLGRPTMRSNVLFVLGEGKHGFMARVLAWCEANGIDPEEVRNHVFFYDGGNLNNDASLDDLRSVIEKAQPDAVVFDTFAATSGIADENAGALASETMNRARELCGDAAVLFVAHPTKGTEDTEAPVLRGSGALAGHADCILVLYADKDYVSRDGVRRDYLALSTEREHQGKNRNAVRETVRGIYLDSIALPDGSESAVLRIDESGRLTKADVFVTRHLEFGTLYTVAELVEASGLSRNTVKAHLNASNLVEKIEQHGNLAALYTRKESE